MNTIAVLCADRNDAAYWIRNSRWRDDARIRMNKREVVIPEVMRFICFTIDSRDRLRGIRLHGTIETDQFTRQTYGHRGLREKVQELREIAACQIR